MNPIPSVHPDTVVFLKEALLEEIAKSSRLSRARGRLSAAEVKQRSQAGKAGRKGRQPRVGTTYVNNNARALGVKGIRSELRITSTPADGSGGYKGNLTFAGVKSRRPLDVKSFPRSAGDHAIPPKRRKASATRRGWPVR